MGRGRLVKVDVPLATAINADRKAYPGWEFELRPFVLVLATKNEGIPTDLRSFQAMPILCDCGFMQSFQSAMVAGVKNYPACECCQKYYYDPEFSEALLGLMRMGWELVFDALLEQQGFVMVYPIRSVADSRVVPGKEKDLSDA